MAVAEERAAVGFDRSLSVACADCSAASARATKKAAALRESVAQQRGVSNAQSFLNQQTHGVS